MDDEDSSVEDFLPLVFLLLDFLLLILLLLALVLDGWAPSETISPSPRRRADSSNVEKAVVGSGTTKAAAAVQRQTTTAATRSSDGRNDENIFCLLIDDLGRIDPLSEQDTTGRRL